MPTSGWKVPLLTGAAAAAFTPASVSGLKLWLKADTGLYQERTGASATTPASADSDPIGSWLDQSGIGNHFVAASDAKRFTFKTNIQNGLPMALTDAVDDVLDTSAIAINQPFTFIAVGKRTTNAAGIYLVYSAGGDLSYNWTGDGSQLTMQGGANLNIGAVADNTSFMATMRFNGASSQGVINNGAPVTGNAGAKNLSGAFSLLPFSQAVLYFGDTLLYEGAVSDADLALLRTYLNTRWALY